MRYLHFMLIILAFGCSSPSGPNALYPFQFSLTDSSGQTMVSGNMKLNLSDSSNVTGNWKISKRFITGNGPVFADAGKFEGNFQDKLLYIDFYPQMRDNNVILSGKFSPQKFAGTWDWITFAGISQSGKFIATNKSAK